MRPRIAAVLLVAVAMLAACGSDKPSASPSTSTTAAVPTTTAPAAFRILVTNDDGYAAPGIDALVNALTALPNTEVTVVAPATNQSGSGNKTTAGTLNAQSAKTASGVAATSVAGYPADSVIYALDQGGMPARPHLVISGINQGQNLGKLIDISGTIRAARAAAQRGIPALAVSQGLGEPPDYAAGVKATLDWLAARRVELAARDTSSTAPATVTNLNIPTCTTGTPRPVVEVPVDTTDANGVAPVDCTTPHPSPVSDVDAFLHGYIARTDDLSLTPSS